MTEANRAASFDWQYEHVCEPGEGSRAGRTAGWAIVTRKPFSWVAIVGVLLVPIGLLNDFSWLLWTAVATVPVWLAFMGGAVAANVARKLMPPGAVHRAAYLRDELAVETPLAKVQIGYDQFTSVRERSACVLVLMPGINMLVLPKSVCPPAAAEQLRQAIESAKH